jgi:hypothetical protein
MWSFVAFVIPFYLLSSSRIAIACCTSNNKATAVIRTLSALPEDSDLRAATWEFLQSIAPECGLTQPLVSRIRRVIKNTLDGVPDDNDEDKSPTCRSSYLLGPRKRAAQSPDAKCRLSDPFCDYLPGKDSVSSWSYPIPKNPTAQNRSIKPVAPFGNAADSCKNALPRITRSSQMLSVGTKKRLSRIRRRAIAEVQATFARGDISAKKADLLLYLEPAQQSVELQRLLSVREEAARRSRIAAAVIRRHVKGGNRDIVALRADLQLALLSR